MLVGTKGHSKYHTDLSGFFCKILCVCVFMCVGGHNCAYVWELELALGISSPELTDSISLTSQLVPGSPCLPLSAGIVDGPPHLPSFYREVRDSNSGLHACRGDALLLKPFN